MLTARGWWFLVVAVLMTVVGVVALPTYTVVPALLGVTLLAWFAWEWAAFHARSNAAVARLRLSRRILQGGRDVPMVWSGLGFEVHVEVGHDGTLGVPFAVLEDRLPVAAEHTDGANELAAELAPGTPAEIVYSLRCPSPGVLRFEGVRVRVADLHGFFYTRTFLRDGGEYFVLPQLADDEGRHRAYKRFNTLPPPGVHRFLRPGTGSELLDLRDYRPGDPPKMIAWKPSARRDKLITKEYESDVPVRCVLFLDTSESVRLGPPGNTPLTRMAGISSAVAQAATANRDLVGLTTFDEHTSGGGPPARTKTHLIDLLRRLAEVAALQPSATGAPPDQLTRRAYPLALDLYPELMHKRVNTVPWGRLWIPLLDRRFGWIVLLMVIICPVIAYIGLYGPVPEIKRAFWGWLFDALEGAASLTPRWWLPARLLVLLFWFVLFIFPPTTLGLLFWFFHGVRGFFGERKRELIRRKQLCALFAVQDGTGAAGIERLLHDDREYGERVGWFLQQHQLRMPVPLYDEQGRYRFRCAGKAHVLGVAMVRAVSRARDNELFVLLADLAELGDDIAPVLRAARMARARHHQVMVIIPWPGDVPPPDDGRPGNGTAHDDRPAEPAPPPWEKPKKPAKGAKKKSPGAIRESRLLKAVQASVTRQYHDAFRRLRRSLGRVGATVVRVNDGDPVRLILERLDRLRGMRSRR
jgi:uncharacterized protein (DUF58 family)